MPCDFAAEGWQCPEPELPGTTKCQFHDPNWEAKDGAAIQARIDSMIAAASGESARLRFDGWVFPESVDFSNFVFPYSVSFNRAQFHGQKTSFQWAQFHGQETTFYLAQFHGQEANFYGAQFHGQETSFHDAQFHGQTTFNWAQFHGQKTSFNWAQFHGGETSFNHAQFHAQQTSFEGAKFHSQETTSFHGSQFYSQKTSFHAVQFHGQDAFFYGAQFHGTTIFHAQWPGNVHFNKAQITDTSSVTFEGGRLSECAFNGSDVQRMRFLDVKWDHPPSTILRVPRRWRLGVYDERLVGTNIAELDLIARTYRALKAFYQQSGQHELVGHFHYGLMEMRWRQRLLAAKNLPGGTRFLTRAWATVRAWANWETLYRYSSGWGEDFVWAGAVLTFLVVAFGLIYAAVGLPIDDGNAFNRIARGIMFSLQTGAFNRLEYYSAPEGRDLLVGWHKPLHFLESVLVPIQFAFFALAIRNRFRR